MFDRDGVDYSELKNTVAPARKPGQTRAEYIAENFPHLRDVTGKTSSTAFIIPTNAPLRRKDRTD